MDRKTGAIILILLASFMMFFALGDVPLTDPDEPVYAETPKEMLAHGDLLSPRIYGEFWYDKPPMYYWLVAGSFKVFGVNEFAARFPSAFLGLLTVLLVYFSTCNLFNNRTGFFAGLMLVTSIEFFALSKAAVTDMTLLFFLTAALLAFLHENFYTMYAMMALATLTKGPIGIVFPLAIIFLYILLTNQWNILSKMKLFSGLGVYLLFAAPWYIAMYFVHGFAFIDTFFGLHNVARFTKPEHVGRVVWYYYLPVMLVGFFPWITMFLSAVKASLYNSEYNEENILKFLQIWWLFVFLFFSVAQTKLISYIFPLFPAIAITVAWNIDRLCRSRYRETHYWWIAQTILIFSAIAGAWFFAQRELPEVQVGAYVLILVLISIGGIISYSIWQKELEHTVYLNALVGVITMFVLLYSLLPAVADRFNCKEIAQNFVTAYDKVSPVYVDKFLRPGFAFYTDIYGKEIIANKNKEFDTSAKDTVMIDQVVKIPGKKFIFLRESVYNRLSEADKSQLTILQNNQKNILFCVQY